jgi:hypothetical protein
MAERCYLEDPWERFGKAITRFARRQQRAMESSLMASFGILDAPD